jgi:hypothetical protein
MSLYMALLSERVAFTLATSIWRARQRPYELLHTGSGLRAPHLATRAGSRSYPDLAGLWRVAVMDGTGAAS